MGMKLKVYAGAEHPHAAQQPREISNSGAKETTTPSVSFLTFFLVLIFLVSGVLAQKEKKESNIGV